MERILGTLKQPAFLIFLIAIVASLWVSTNVARQWVETRVVVDVFANDAGDLVTLERGKEVLVAPIVDYADSPLRQAALDTASSDPSAAEQWVRLESDTETPRYARLSAKYHFGFWSLLPAFVAIALCLITREALPALLAGVVSGAFMLGRFDITDAVLVPALATESAAGILILYLWLVGGLLGIWSRTGAAQAFAEYMTKNFVVGPRSAKFVCWLMGILFFQGGTISVVLVGTIVKPVADKQQVAHEELAYIVDSTASPIACLIAFNAWPAYVQALIYLPGVGFLASQSDRISFFFQSIPLSFYAMFAVTGTLLVSLGYRKFAGPPLRRAIERAATSGALDAPDARPMSARELHTANVPDGYARGILEFTLPLILLITVAVGTFVVMGSPKVNWAFGIALMTAVTLALIKGMSLRQVIEGIGEGLKGVVLASVVLVLAITIGGISQEIGAGTYLVELLGHQIPPMLLPLALLVITMVIAFSTGTSWGTYAITFPLAMPLALAVADNAAIENVQLFLAICFATVLNGSVFGDQCSPISDTTILSAMTTGCDLTDHVTTQLVPAMIAMTLAAVGWTMLAFWVT